MSPSSDLIENLGSRLGPDEGLWIGIVMLEVVLDGGFEFGNAFEDAGADAVSGDKAEEALNLVKPGPGSGCEVHVEARMPFEPRLDLGVLVCGVIVGDQMDVEVRRRLSVDAAQKLKPAAAAVAQ